MKYDKKREREVLVFMALVVTLVIVAGEFLMIAHYPNMTNGMRAIEAIMFGKWLIDLHSYLRGKTIL